MKKYGSLIITIGLLIVIVGGTYLLSKSAESKNFREISYEKYEKLAKADDETLVYFGSKEDTETLDLLKEIAKDSNLSIKYLYTENLTDEQKKSLGENKQELTLVSKELEENVYAGEFSKTNILSYLKENELVAKEYISIGADEYLNLIKGKNVVVFVGASSCGYCTKFKPEMNTVVDKHNINIYYIELDKLSQNDLNKVYGSTSFFTEEEWGTPTTFIFTNGKLVNRLSGYTTASEVKKFLKTNKVID